MIEYLVKFVPKHEYAIALLSGDLFMRPASYFHKLEEGQGDIREGSIFPYAQIRKNDNLPIFCMYMVCSDDITDGTTTIPSRVINDFKCGDGYAVIIPYSVFEKRIQKIETGGYGGSHAPVTYRLLQPQEFADFANSKRYENLFIKAPRFSYQKEYRVVIAKTMYEYSEERQPESITFHIPQGFSDCGVIVSIHDCINSNGDCELPLKAGSEDE